MRVSNPSIGAIWNLGFRPFFLLGALWSAAHVLLWVLFQGGKVEFSLNDPLVWHAHEMIFGFSSAIVAGFLLTASQNWTGIPGVHGKKLRWLVLVWVVARILSVASGNIQWLYAIVDLAFYPMLGGYLIPYLGQASQKRNRIFLILFFVLFLINLAIHASALGFFSATYPRTLLLLAMYAIVMMISVIGGRVIPFFTGNAVPGANSFRHPLIEKTSEISIALAGVAVFWNEFSTWTAALCFVTAMVHFLRWLFWKPWKSKSIPILWILYAGYLWIPVGLVLRALASMNILAPSASTHALTAGAIGIMIYGMISRVALGHSGRPIQANPWVVAGYLSIVACAIIRVFGPIVFPYQSLNMILVSGWLWVFAYVIYVFAYVAILIRPRLDGKPG